MKNIVLIVVLLLPFALFAQEEFNVGSPYNIYGLGEQQYYVSNRTEGMGVLGIALTGNYVNSINPAINYRLPYTIISFGFEYDFLHSSNGNKSFHLSNADVSGFNVGIPIDKDLGWVLNLGFNQMNQINYKIVNNTFTNGLPVKATYAGNGGLARINIGMCFAGLKNVSAGFEYNYSFGNVKKLALLDFNNSQYVNSYRRIENNISGSFLKGGLAFNIGRMFTELKNEDLTIAFLYQTKYNLTSEAEVINQTVVGLDTTTLSPADIKYPQAFGFGLMNKFGDRVIVAGDLFMQQWSEYKVGNQTSANLRNSMRFALGVEITPPPKPEFETFWTNKYYRIGAFYEKTNLFVNNETINFFGINAGIGIPLNQYNTIDIGLSFATRGKTSNGLIKDNIFKITAGFNFGELWFIRISEEEK
ncbi:MAG: outer membrane protein transport protein [Ignavibacteria bacterium]|nr:outer membrane protein transport protein [Ignavibacteria bacterium]